MEIFIDILIIHLILDMLASLIVLKMAPGAPAEKRNQLLFSFLVPVLGPVITMSVHLSDKFRKDALARNNWDESYDNGGFTADHSDFGSHSGDFHH